MGATVNGQHRKMGSPTAIGRLLDGSSQPEQTIAPPPPPIGWGAHTLPVTFILGCQ